METKNRLVPATLNHELDQVQEYSFFQLNALLRQFCRLYSDANEQNLSIRYRALASLGFPASDIASGEWIDEADDAFLELTVSFLGLYGPASPLPVYYTERVIQSDDPNHPSRDLMDLFNHRFISLLQQCWEKYRYYVNYHVDGRDQYSRWLLSLAGVDQTLLKSKTTLKWHRLLPYAGLLGKGSCSADRLSLMVQNYFEVPDVSVVPWVPRTLSIDATQCNAMGAMNASLGSDLVMGDTIQDCSGKFQLHLSGLSRQQYRQFLPNGERFQELVDLVKYLLTDPLEFDLCLSLRPQPDQNDEMDDHLETGAELGWNVSLGDDLTDTKSEPARICVSDYCAI